MASTTRPTIYSTSPSPTCPPRADQPAPPASPAPPRSEFHPSPRDCLRHPQSPPRAAKPRRRGVAPEGGYAARRSRVAQGGSSPLIRAHVMCALLTSSRRKGGALRGEAEWRRGKLPPHQGARDVRPSNVVAPEGG